MRGNPRILLVLDEGVDRTWVESHLPDESGVEIGDVVDSMNRGWERIDDKTVDVLVLAMDRESETALELARASVVELPDRPVILVSHGPANGYVRRAFEAGADDLIVLDDPQDGRAPSGDLAFAVQKAIARRAMPIDPRDRPLATMVCVLGPKGGIGKTLTSCNLAVSLAESDARVALVDLDLQFGDLGLSLGLAPVKTSFDLATSGGSLDSEKIEAYMATHSSGVHVLLAPSRPDQAGAITVSFLQDLYTLLRAHYDYVIVDTPPGFTPEVIATIDASSHVCMVGMLDALSLKNTRLGLETLELMGYEHERIRIVLNRADSSVGITHNDVVKVIGRPPDVLVPSHRDITRSVNDGTPIAMSSKRSEAAKAFHSLADIYAATRPGAKPKRTGRGLLMRSRG